MPEQNTQASTTAETQKPDGPEIHIRSFGDPVIVDDGGSVRITHGGRRMQNLQSANTDELIGAFGASARVSVLSLSPAGPYAAATVIVGNEEVVVSSSAGSVTLRLEVNGGAGVLKVKSSSACEEKAHHTNKYGYSRVDGPITQVVVTRASGPALVLLAPNLGSTTTFVSVEKQI